MSNFDDILTRQPIDGTAGSVVSQGGASSGFDATTGDLEKILARLDARRVELKRLLGIQDRNQHLQLTELFKEGEQGSLNDEQWRLLTEYVANGRNLFNLSRHVSAEKKKSRFEIILMQ